MTKTRISATLGALIAFSSACRSPQPRMASLEAIPALSFAPLAPALYVTYPAFLAGPGELEDILRRNGFMLRANISDVEEYARDARLYAKGLSRSAKRGLMKEVDDLERRLPAMRKELAECDAGLPQRERVETLSRRYIPGVGAETGRFEVDVVYKDGRKETLDWNQIIDVRSAKAKP